MSKEFNPENVISFTDPLKIKSKFIGKDGFFSISLGSLKKIVENDDKYYFGTLKDIDSKGYFVPDFAKNENEVAKYFYPIETIKKSIKQYEKEENKKFIYVTEKDLLKYGLKLKKES